MRKPIAVVINWFGPYTYEEAIKAAKTDYDDGLYVVIGREPNQKKDRFQYIGIANNLHQRLLQQKGLFNAFSQKCELWLGESASTRIPGKKIGNKNPAIDLAESAHIYFLQPPLNVNKSVYPPKSEITVVNRWWNTDYDTPRKLRPIDDWPDMIDYYGKEYCAKLVWSKLKRGRIQWYSKDELNE
jgi:hypothetical protein